MFVKCDEGYNLKLDYIPLAVNKLYTEHYRDTLEDFLDFIFAKAPKKPLY